MFTKDIEKYKQNGSFDDKLIQISEQVLGTFLTYGTFRGLVAMFAVIHVINSDITLTIHIRFEKIQGTCEVWSSKPFSDLGYSGIEFPQLCSAILKIAPYFDPQRKEYSYIFIEVFVYEYLNRLSDQDFENFMRFFSLQPETGSKTKRALQKKE